jgi:hypothetical protein
MGALHESRSACFFNNTDRAVTPHLTALLDQLDPDQQEQLAGVLVSLVQGKDPQLLEFMKPEKYDLIKKALKRVKVSSGFGTITLVMAGGLVDAVKLEESLR